MYSWKYERLFVVTVVRNVSALCGQNTQFFVTSQHVVCNVPSVLSLLMKVVVCC